MSSFPREFDLAEGDGIAWSAGQSPMGADVGQMRVLAVVPTGGDAPLTRNVLQEHGIECEICPNVISLCEELRHGAGAILLADEVLDSGAIDQLVEQLAEQPAWSDLAVVVLTRGGAHSTNSVRALMTFSNVILLERPIRVQTLVSAVKIVLRGRRRQYQIREYLHERERAAGALRDSEERLRIALGAAEMGTWRIDLNSRLYTCDASLSRVLGLEETEWSCTLDEFLERVAPEDRGDVRQVLDRAMRDRIPYFAEYRIDRTDNTRRWFRDRGRVIEHWDGRRFLTGAAVDVTEVKLAEQQLKALNETLEQRVAERTAVAEHQAHQLRRLAAELTQAEQRERRRLAQILHDDLQQLLVAAKLGVELTTVKANDPLIKQELGRVKELMNQAVDSSRSLTVALSPPILYDGGLLPALEWLARWMQDNHGLKVEIEGGTRREPLAEDAQVFLFQCVRELLFNVVKHSGVHEARVRAEATDTEYCLEVRDNGSGFDASILNREESTPGFGLFSIRERLESMGGRFEVETTPGAGSRIRLYAPLETGNRPNAADSDATLASRTSENGRRASDTADAGTIRVLLADDHRILRMGVASLLRDEPSIEIVGEATDGQMAVELSRALHPDIVIMDITMPRMNGIEATRVITGELPEVRVIGMSMHDEDDMALAMRQAGASAYLTKGCPSGELRRVIRSVVEASR